jgi:predicted RNase H-like HicB family nuclease
MGKGILANSKNVKFVDLLQMADKYTDRIEWSEEDGVHIARCLEFPSLMAHGNTAVKALSEIEKAVAESLKWMEEENEPLPEPFGLKTPVHIHLIPNTVRRFLPAGAD